MRRAGEGGGGRYPAKQVDYITNLTLYQLMAHPCVTDGPLHIWVCEYWVLMGFSAFLGYFDIDMQLWLVEGRHLSPKYSLVSTNNPIHPIVPRDTHIILYYMGGLIVGVNTLYRALSCLL